MKININYLNDEFELEFDTEMKAGLLIAHLIKYLEIPVPVLNFYGNEIVLQLYSMGYTVDLKKSFKEQNAYINFNKSLGLYETVHVDIADFNVMISNCETKLTDQVKISRVENKYSTFRDQLREGPDAYIKIIKQKNLSRFINEAFIENDYEKLKTDFDPNGLFTRNIVKANYFVDDKSCDEEALHSIAIIVQHTFDDDACDYFVTMVFPEDNIFTINKYGKADLGDEEINDLYAKYGHPFYRVKLIKQGVEVEAEFESLRYSLEQRLKLFNRLLAKLEPKERWYILNTGSCLLATPEEYEALNKSNLLPPDSAYFNRWEY